MRLSPGAAYPPLPAEIDDRFLTLCDDAFDMLREAGALWVTREDVTRWLACQQGESTAYTIRPVRDARSGLVTHVDIEPVVEP